MDCMHIKLEVLRTMIRGPRFSDFTGLEIFMAEEAKKRGVWRDGRNFLVATSEK